MYFENLRFRDLRCFEAADLEFVHPDQESSAPLALRNVNLLLGDNGAGKTTVLRALALVLLGETMTHSGFVPYRLVRRTAEATPARASVRANVHVHIQDDPEPAVDRKFLTDIDRRGDFDIISKSSRPERLDSILYDESSPGLFLVGYGSTRRVELSDRFDLGAQEKARRLRYRRVATLFEEHVGLTPLSLWLPRLAEGHPERFAEVTQILDALLADQARFTGEREGSDYMFEVGGVAAPFPALSDGYRAFIGWVSDLLYHMCQVCPPRLSLTRLQGVVLIDEIDLHLHPDWQRTVVPQISATLPRLQFIFTTHSALVTGTLQAENIQVVSAAHGRPSTVQRLRERVHGLGVDQILLGSYFNLTSTRAPDADDQLLELSRRARAGDPDAALGVIRLLAHGVPEIDAPTPPAPPDRRSPRAPAKPGSKASAKKAARKGAR